MPHKAGKPETSYKIYMNNNNTPPYEETVSVSRTFNPEIARDVGTDAAIILRNIEFWVKKEEAEEKEDKYHDGKYWTYNSATAFQKLFTWLTPRQISRNLEKLEKKGYVVVGNYNKHKYDRTKWYSLGERYYNSLIHRISPNGKMDWSKTSNALVNNDQPIPYIKPDKTNIYKNPFTANAVSTTNTKTNSALKVKKSTPTISYPQDLNEYKKYSKRVGGINVSFYKSEFGSGKDGLVPLQHNELYQLAKLKNISPSNCFDTYTEVIEQIIAGDIPKKYNYKNTYDALSRYIDNKLRYEVYSNSNEIEQMELDDWAPDKIKQCILADRRKRKLIDAGLL